MPRTKNEYKQEALSNLKTQILEKSGITLSRPSDCDELSHHVWQATNQLINPITFKRIFGFVKYPFSPSLQTLNILSQFLGFKDWYDFEQACSDFTPISTNELAIYLSFFEFDSINRIEEHDGGLQSFSRKIALRFREDSETFKQVIPALASNSFAQMFFIEHFPDYDNLVSYYYLLYEAYLKNKKTTEAQLFGNSILFLKVLWTLNKKEANVYIQKMDSFSLHKNIHPYIIGRIYACKLVHNYIFGNQKLIPELIKEFNDKTANLPIDGNHFRDFPAAHYIFSEALFLTKQYQSCISVVEEALSKFPIRTEFIRKGYYRQMQIFWYLSKCKLGESQLENDFLLKINPENYYFISKRHFSIYFHWAKFLNNQKIECLNEAKKLAILNKNKFLTNLLESEL
jgi:tetratricopeptide (TPR) repeat protein